VTFDRFFFNDADGYRLQAIAKHLGVHYATVSRRLKQLEIRATKRAE
jgi:transposase